MVQLVALSRLLNVILSKASRGLGTQASRKQEPASRRRSLPSASVTVCGAHVCASRTTLRIRDGVIIVAVILVAPAVVVVYSAAVAAVAAIVAVAAAAVSRCVRYVYICCAVFRGSQRGPLTCALRLHYTHTRTHTDIMKS